MIYRRKLQSTESNTNSSKGLRGLLVRRCKRAGQSTVEFALISFFLFAFILGIFEVARFLFIYSVVSNAAQEGSRYGIVRPRDGVPSYMVTYSPTGPLYLGTSVPTQVVVPNGNCNVVEKTREKVWGVAPTDVNVRFWYDTGNGTPVVVTSNPSNQSYYDCVILPGNRVVVSASYTFNFVTPLFTLFVPNGINVNMTSARTMVNDGSRPITNCISPYTPGPTRTPVSYTHLTLPTT